MHVILVTGSHTLTAEEREWAEKRIREVLDARANEYGARNLHLIHGDAYGVDRIAAGLAHSKDFFRISAFPAQWGQYGKAAGHKRNAVMVQEVEMRNQIGESVECIAFFPKGVETPGAAGCVALAKQARIPVVTHTRSLASQL